jgi:hypothetical protein
MHENVIYIKNLAKEADETAASLKGKVKGLFGAINQQFPDETRVERTKDRQPRAREDGHQPWPAAVRVKLANPQDVHDILREKSTLRNKEGYQEVYVEPARLPHEIRFQASMRMVAKAFPNLEYKKGSLQQKKE